MAKISLCLIVGNVEEYIERCLKSFLCIADEVCLVRAIGNQTPDKTFEIAAQVCREFFYGKKDENGGLLSESGQPFLKLADYQNKPGHEDWPHVDDFAAARQMSFDLATGDYCFWCDTDDVLTSGAEIIREHARNGSYPAYLFPYDIFGRGIKLARERMMVRGGGKWICPVHECYQFPFAVQGFQDDRVVVTHLPHTTKTGSNDRNLRILESIPESEMTCGLWYHLHGEYAGKNRIPEAVEAAKKALADPQIGRPEKYELLLNLSRISKHPDVKAQFLVAAYGANPNRREALGLLTCNALDYGKNEDALSYARQMMATPPPATEEWNNRVAAYDWLGVEIYTQALRMNGMGQEAESIRRAALMEAGGPLIALVHATRGRAVQASVAKKLWYDLAANPARIEHIFCFDADDQESAPLQRMNHIVLPKGGGCVAAWNNGVMGTIAPVIVQLSDDWCPPPRWDELILERLGDVTQPKVLAVNDGKRPDNLLCLAICTRAYLQHDQFLFHPFFTGVYSDNWFTEEAYRRQAVIEARDLVFTHSHPAFGTAKVDATYAAQNAPERYAEGLQVIESLRAGTDWSSVPGFFNFWAFYNFMAARLQSGDTVAEVGVWMGRSIIYLAQLLKKQGKQVKIIAVDTFAGELNQPAHEHIVKAHGGSLRAVFEANIKRCGVADMIEIVQGDSAASAAQVADGSLAFCFIDAAHDYESVKRDITAWQSKIKAGGVFAGHDIQHDEVERAVKELVPGYVKNLPVWFKV